MHHHIAFTLTTFAWSGSAGGWGGSFPYVGGDFKLYVSFISVCPPQHALYLPGKPRTLLKRCGLGCEEAETAEPEPPIFRLISICFICVSIHLPYFSSATWVATPNRQRRKELKG
jgi:hypothetical protein